MFDTTKLTTLKLETLNLKLKLMKDLFGKAILDFQTNNSPENIITETNISEADEMEVLVTLVQAYEDKHYPIGPADPIEAIKFRMEQQGLAAKDLEPYIGSSGRVSEVLNRKRALSLRMIKRLHEGLKIPYESLLSHAA